ncbi:MAG: ABC transporter permease [Polyangia bacterium]
MSIRTVHRIVVRGSRGAVLPLAVLSIWALATSHGWANREVLPTPVTVLRTIGNSLGDAWFWTSVGHSLARMSAGFLIASTTGLLLGVLLGASRWGARLGGPGFHAFRQVAPFAWIPLISAWFGTGESTKVVFIAVAAFPAMVINAIEGVQAVTRQHRELARVLEISRWRFITRVVVPGAMPQIFTGIHLTLVVSWLATVGAEYFLQIGPGVASILIEGRALVRMDLVLFGILVIGLVGFALNLTVRHLEALVLRWRPPSTQESR